MHISLTPELESIVKAKVESGLYNNASEVIRDALRFVEKNEEFIYQQKLKALRDELNIGLSQAQRGELSDGEAFMDTLMDDLKSE